MPNDTWVVEAPNGTVIAHANVGRETEEVAEAWGAVHPDHRGLGIGSLLLELVDERAARCSRGAANSNSRSATRTARQWGCCWHGASSAFGRSVTWRSPSTVARRCRATGGDRDRSDRSRTGRADGQVAVRRGFRGEWGYPEVSFEAWRARNVEDRDFDPGLWLLATEDGTPVAALTALVSGDRGWVLELAVLAPWRGRGIGSAMLRSSFASFAERGLSRAMLNVDSENPTGAVGVYERVGMRAVRGWDIYERTLPAS